MSDDTKALVEWLQGGVSESRAGRMYKRALDTIERLERDRDALAERCEKLREALRNLLEAIETEARAVLAARNAEDNYSSPERELDALQNAMVAASNAEKAARTVLAAPKDARGAAIAEGGCA